MLYVNVSDSICLSTPPPVDYKSCNMPSTSISHSSPSEDVAAAAATQAIAKMSEDSLESTSSDHSR